MLAWAIIGVLVAVYCVAKAVIDVRQRRYAWAFVGFACAAAILLTPIQTHAVRIDIPPTEAN